MLEVIVYKIYELQPKKTMSLLYSSSQSQVDGRIPSEKFQARFYPIGPSGEKLTVEDGIVLKGTHIAIPHKKCQATHKPIYEGHLGLNKCNFRAKDTVYLPGLHDQLEKLVLNCELCLKYPHSKCKLKPSTSLGPEIPVHPWTKLTTDIFHFESASHLLIVDYKQISSCIQIVFKDRLTCCKPMQANIF